MRCHSVLRRRAELGFPLRLAIWLFLGIALLPLQVAAGLAAETGIRLEVAGWVPARDGSYGWWGAVPAGGKPSDPAHQTKTEAMLSLPPGDYDVYWVQDYDNRDNPLRLAVGVKVESGQVASVRADSGIELEVASWVPARDDSYGWWGAVRSGDSPKKPLHWSKTATALLLVPGEYDVYWVQDYDNRDNPLRLAAGVKVESGQVASVRADSGIKLEVASWVPARDDSYGWWGAVRSGDSPKKPLHWSKAATALLLVPGEFDVYWVQDYDNRDNPLRLAAGVKVETGQVASVRADSGIKLEVASWVPARDGEYGWWGAVRAGDSPKKPLHWSKAATALLLVPGEYDVYWVQDYDNRENPLRLAAGVKVDSGQVPSVRADSGVMLKVPADTPALDASYGWWGLIRAGGGPDDRVHWSKGRFDLPLLALPGTYDVFWRQDYDSKPERRATGVAVAAGDLTQVELAAPGGTASTAQTTVKSVLTFGGVVSQEAGGLGADFPLGIRRVDASFSWKDAPSGLRIGIRWSIEGVVVLEQNETLDRPEGKSTWYLTLQSGEALPVGSYQVQILENGLALAPPMPFTVGQTAAAEGGGTPPVPAAAAMPGELLASDDFEDPGSGWQYLQVSGIEAGYRDGRYRVALAATPNLFTIAVQERPPLDDAIIEVEATPETGSAAHPYGLMVRGQDQANFHAFVIGGDGSYAAVSIAGGNPVLDSAIDATLPAGTLSPPGQANRLRLVAHGSKLSFYVNDQLVTEVAQAKWPAGHAGFFVSTTGAAPVAVAFDNWRVFRSTGFPPAP